MSTSASRQISSVLVMVLICTAAPGLVAAQTPAQKTAQAEELFNEGLKQMSVSRFAEACTAFERSQSIDESIGTLMNLANCREKNGQLATAMQLFTDSADQLGGATDPDSAALRKVSTDRAAALELRVSRLTLRIAANQPDGFELRVGDTVIPREDWNRPKPLDGGAHQVSASAPGHQPWSESVTVSNEGDDRELGVPLLTPQVDAGAQLEVPHRPLPTPPPPSGPSQILPISLGVGALILGAGAIVLDLNARGLQDDAVATMNQANMLPPGFMKRDYLVAESEDLHEKAKTRRYIAQGIGAAAIGCAGAAVYLYIRNRGRESTATAQRSIAPMWGVDGQGGGVAGMQLSGSW